MFQLFICHTLKTAIITYPKAGSCSLANALIPQNDPNPITIKYKWIRCDQVISFDKIIKNIPLDYAVYIFCRDPVDRWISGFVFLLQTDYDFFYQSLEDCNALEKVTSASIEQLQKLICTILHINYYTCDLNNLHLGKVMMALALIKTVYNDCRFVNITDLDQVLCNINNIPLVQFVKSNSADDGYNVGFANAKKSDDIGRLNKRFKSILSTPLRGEWDRTYRLDDTYPSAINQVKKYLHLEKLIYNRIYHHGEDAISVLIDILNDEDRSLRDLFSNDQYLQPGFVLEYLDSDYCASELKDRLICKRHVFDDN